MKPRVYRGGKPNQVTFYLHIPADIVKALEISPDDEFELKVDKNGDEITLCYKKMGVKGAESLASLRRGWIAPL